MAGGAMGRSAVAGCAWLVVGGYGVQSALVGDDDNWRLAYSIFTVAVAVGAALTVLLAHAATGDGHNERPRLRMAGLGLGGLAVVLGAIAAWALPVWMTLLGAGLALVALASPPPLRRRIAVLAAGQLVGIAVLIATIEAEVGTADEYGDYPAAVGIALLVTAAIMIAGVVTLTKGPAADGTVDGYVAVRD